MPDQTSLFFGLEAGRLARDLGIELVAGDNPEFVTLMREVARKLSQRQGSVSTDDLRQLATVYGLEPRHQNAWGAIFRGKGWQVVGRKASTKVTNHAREIRVWKWEASA